MKIQYFKNSKNIKFNQKVLIIIFIVRFCQWIIVKYFSLNLITVLIILGTLAFETFFVSTLIFKLQNKTEENKD